MLPYINHAGLCLLVSVSGIALAGFLLAKYREQINRSHIYTGASVATLVLFFTVMIIWGRHMLIPPFNDSGTIWFSVADIVENGVISDQIDGYTSCAWSTNTSNHDYFLVYPNSRFLVAFLLPFARFMHGVMGLSLRSEDAYFALVILNTVFVAIAILFASLTARRERGTAAALCVLLISLVFLPYYMNAYKLYSDTMSMPFVALSIWLISRGNHSAQRGKKLLYCFFAGISLAMGILLKGSVAVLFVAAVIYLLVKEKKIGTALPGIAVMLLGVLLITQGWAVKADRLSWLDTAEKDRYELPVMHWIMMASHGDGSFHQEDLEYSMSFESLEERKTAALETYLARVKDYGPGAYLRFLTEKTAMTFSDGTYSQMQHLNLFTDTPIGEIVSVSGKYYGEMKFITFCIICFLYVLILASAVINTRRDCSLMLLMNVCFFGLVLFFALWESKSRYLLNFTIMFILMAALSLDELAEIIKKRSAARNGRD